MLNIKIAFIILLSSIVGLIVVLLLYFIDKGKNETDKTVLVKRLKKKKGIKKKWTVKQDGRW